MTSKKLIHHSFISMFLVLGLFALTSCGHKNSSSAVPTAVKRPEIKPVLEQEELDPGIYVAELHPVNRKLRGNIQGEAKLTIKNQENEFIAEVEVNGADSAIKHFQEVLTGSECPGENEDTNFDGVIDDQEILSYSGHVLIPLDSKLQNQFEGMSYGPIANEEGYYLYRRSASYKSVLDDLMSFDDDPEDTLVKLTPSEKMRLVHKVVVIYGISGDVELPETVKSRPDRSINQSIPVLCGQLKRIGN